METINAVTFGFMSKKGEWLEKTSKDSLNLLMENCGANHVIFTVVAEQKTAQSTRINWKDQNVLSDVEIKEMINYAKSLGLKVILKPMVNVSDGTWRAHINFFDNDVPPEPKWSEWVQSYSDYIEYYANMAEELSCEMLIIGCELVNSDRRENEWRKLIKEIRSCYSGSISYNCDKYQEDHVKWWDAVDVISSSGYYPIDSWEKELDRIEEVVEKFSKPFFFCEIGCPSRKNSEFLPNNWEINDGLSLDSQTLWYEKMFEACNKRSWVNGYGIWDWKATLYELEDDISDDDYAVYGKKKKKIIKQNFKKVY